MYAADDENHTDTKIEGLEETVRIHFAVLGKVFKMGSTGQEAEIHTAFNARGRTRANCRNPTPVMCARAETQPLARMFFSAGA